MIRSSFRLGDKVPTDGVLFEGHIKVSQAALNGESRDENKTAADNLDEAESTDYASANKVFMGSVVPPVKGIWLQPSSVMHPSLERSTRL